MLNGLGAQLGAWEKFEGPNAGVISYFHKAFYKYANLPPFLKLCFFTNNLNWYRTFVDSGMKDDALALKKQHPGFRLWVCFFLFSTSIVSHVKNTAYLSVISNSNKLSLVLLSITKRIRTV